ncbi:MAG: site-2 protease family protein [Acidimicrobiia bacterium]|nr:site-2 protease family protein [Acidimicrobiia bacterium]
MESITGSSAGDVAVFVGILMMSVVVHEVSHGFLARYLGDPTAEQAGRLTLNPIKHLHPIGSVLLPAALAFVGAPIFGWARPVPVNPQYFRQPTYGMAAVALVGPLSNLAIAVAAGRLILPLVSGIGEVLVFGVVFLNLLLAVFNMIPIPPLDGSKLIPIFLTDRGRLLFYRYGQFGVLFLLAALLLGDSPFADMLLGVVTWLLPLTGL